MIYFFALIDSLNILISGEKKVPRLKILNEPVLTVLLLLLEFRKHEVEHRQKRVKTII